MRSIALCALVVLSGAIPAWAQSPQPEWISDPHSGCKIWNPYPRPNEGISWSGTCKDGLADGKGTLQWSENGAPTGRYDGDYRQGKVEGQGTYTWPDG